MSGDAIRLVVAGRTNPEESNLARFIDAINRFPPETPTWTLIGGVAVVLRVGGEHRATQDIDTLTRQSAELATILTDNGGTSTAAHRFIVPIDTRLDIMEVGAIPDPALVTTSDYVFALAREWAFATGRIEHVEITDIKGNPITAASLRIATIAGLLALKTTSLLRRAYTIHPNKQWSDTADLLELLEASDEELTVDLNSAPNDLLIHMATVLEKVCITDARYTRARLISGQYRTYAAGLAIGARLSQTLRTRIASEGDGGTWQHRRSHATRTDGP